jgi:hypothetical protein
MYLKRHNAEKSVEQPQLGGVLTLAGLRAPI